MHDTISRRQFVQGGALIAASLSTPRWVSAMVRSGLRQPHPDAVLVVCQLSGGNDGLNTVVPYGDKLYYSLRPTIGIPANEVLKLDDGLGLHPSLTGMKELYDAGKVAVIGNVGYPQPNRSHFRSMEIWQSASLDGSLKHGWLGRHVDLSNVAAVGLSHEKPLALASENGQIPCVGSLSDEATAVGRSLWAGYEPKRSFANDAFGVGFRQAAQAVASLQAPRVVYFSAGGFDTHARQPEQHARLLDGLGNALVAFQDEMEALDKADKVIVMVYSEFGRRAAENSSQGTDHGAAAPLFLVGNRVKGGLYGGRPDLQNLVAGDLDYRVDFREVYATLLDRWLGSDSEAVLGSRFEVLDVLV